MVSLVRRSFSNAEEAVHMGALVVTALALAMGLFARDAEWVRVGVSLTLLLPPLRIFTSILGEARAKRFGVAAMGAAVLAVLFFSRHIS
jgi:hypothetical protein